MSAVFSIEIKGMYKSHGVENHCDYLIKQSKLGLTKLPFVKSRFVLDLAKIKGSHISPSV